VSVEEIKEEIITKKILGFDVEVIKIEDFKEYYEKNLGSFNSFSEKSFLKAVKIPPQYFLEQPEETRQELLTNKFNIIPEKLAGKYISVLQKDGKILNCARVEYDRLENLYERISLSPANLKKLTPVRDFIKEGYSSFFMSSTLPEEGKYNLGLFIDFPVLLHKAPVVNVGFFYCPKKGEDNYKNLYVENQEVNFEDYLSLDLLVDDLLNIKMKEIEEEKIIETLQDKLLLREIEEILIKLSGLKVIPKNYVAKISKFISKMDSILPTVFSLVEVLLVYEQSFNSFKRVNKIRNISKDVMFLLEDEVKE